MGVSAACGLCLSSAWRAHLRNRPRQGCALRCGRGPTLSNGYFPPLFAEVETIIVLHANSAFRSFAVAEPERALLFIDMRSSTAIAERLSELGFLNLLNRMSASSVLSPISAPAF